VSTSDASGDECTVLVFSALESENNDNDDDDDDDENEAAVALATLLVDDSLLIEEDVVEDEGDTNKALAGAWSEPSPIARWRFVARLSSWG